MAVYVVNLKEWFSGSPQEFETVDFICKASRCYTCGRRPKFSKAWGHHALSHGYGDVWCTEKCFRKFLETGKEFRPDKRQLRRINRRRKPKLGGANIHYSILDSQNLKALMLAIDDSDKELQTQIQNVADYLFVRTATGQDLDRASNLFDTPPR